MLDKIKEVLDEKVRPQLSAHGGDVQIIDFKEGILKVRLLGQCSGCPSAQLTTEELIEAQVTEEVKEVKRVVLIQEVSQDLIDMAKKILSHQ